MPPVQVQGLPSPRYLATSHRNDLGATSVMGTDDLLEILCVELGRECRGGHEVAEHDREPTIKITRGVSPIRRPSCNGATSLSDAIWMCSGDQGIGLSRSRNASEQYRLYRRGKRTRRNGPKARPSGLLNPWLQPGERPGICRPGICRWGFYQSDICQPARAGQLVADVEGPQQPLFPRKPTSQC